MGIVGSDTNTYINIHHHHRHATTMTVMLLLGGRWLVVCGRMSVVPRRPPCRHSKKNEFRQKVGWGLKRDPQRGVGFRARGGRCSTVFSFVLVLQKRAPQRTARHPETEKKEGKTPLAPLTPAQPFPSTNSIQNQAQRSSSKLRGAAGQPAAGLAQWRIPSATSVG